ncbi:MAG: hypothetical protein QW569_03235 [Candidatus Bathyarchaeia archaeon]
MEGPVAAPKLHRLYQKYLYGYDVHYLVGSIRAPHARDVSGGVNPTIRLEAYG